jgi:MYXO-CTERM domain-containing protein
MPTPEAPILGSAGGAANVTSAASAGGNGGGVILLVAADIQIDGTIEADGDSPIAASGVARGGGSGGFIAIIASHLTGTGTVSARGGNGPAAPGVAPSILANHGGGGGGGVIFFQASDVASTLKSDVAGGATGNCATFAAAGKLTGPANDPTFCVDADQDGILSDACGGDDCNDGDPAVHPTAKEVCNGVDDNCVEGIDEGATICPAGSTCDATVNMCVGAADAGVDAGPPAGAPPDYIAFESGCSVGDGGNPLGALAMAGLGLGALVTRRRRASASTKVDR